MVLSGCDGLIRVLLLKLFNSVPINGDVLIVALRN
jgi:hypothetical protein